MIKKIGISFLAVLALAVMIGAQVFAAAYGEVQFSDPQTSVGEEFEVTAKMTCGGALIGDGELTLEFDPEYLEFVEGTGSKDEGEGTVTIFNAGTGSETELDYTITFKALKEGETVIEVTDSESYLWNNATLHLTLGTSTVTIGEGDGTSSGPAKGDGPEVTIDGVKYNIVNDIPPAAIPQGFSVAEASFNGENVNALQQDTSSQQAFYLTDGTDSQLFLYFGEDGRFTPFEMVEISESSYIIFLEDDGSAEVPKGFKEATLTYNDHPFPVWQNPEQEDYYLIYALNNSGEKTMYLYDNKEETYQRYNPDLLSSKPAAKKADTKSSGFVGGLLDFIGNHLKPFLIAFGALLLFLLIWALVLSRKVHNRNVEIDDLYDELDGKKAGSVAGPREAMTEDFSGVLPYGEEMFGEDAFDAYNDTFEFDDDDDFLDDITGTIPVSLTDTLAKHKPIGNDYAPKRRKKVQVKPLSNERFHIESDDDFKLDFIDFDD